MDFWAPPPASDRRAKRPVVVLVHGGSFVGGDKSSFKPLATVLAQRGFVVGSINYVGLEGPQNPNKVAT